MGWIGPEEERELSLFLSESPGGPVSSFHSHSQENGLDGNRTGRDRARLPRPSRRSSLPVFPIPLRSCWMPWRCVARPANVCMVLHATEAN